MKNLLSLHKRKSMKKLINSVFFIALCSCMAMVSCISDGDDSDTGSIELVAGDKLPVFSVTMNDGRVVTHESLRGKVSFIVFFNTGCKDCRRELPVIQQIYEHHPHMPLIAISRAEDAASVVLVEPVSTTPAPNTASRPTWQPSTTIHREPMNALSSIITGAA